MFIVDLCNNEMYWKKEKKMVRNDIVLWWVKNYLEEKFLILIRL